MFVETIQPKTSGLSFGHDGHHTAPGFENNNVILTLEKGYHEGYRNHANHYNKLLKGDESILELGCGSGNLSYFIRDAHPNITYVTVDINSNVPNSPYIQKENHFVKYTNLPFQIEKDGEIFKFDYILSYEHLEHLPEDSLDTFFQNIKKHCHKDTEVIATASTQIFPVHVSVFSREKWIGIIERNGFQMINKSYLTQENCPPNFPIEETIELVFKPKE